MREAAVTESEIFGNGPALKDLSAAKMNSQSGIYAACSRGISECLSDGARLIAAENGFCALVKEGSEGFIPGVSVIGLHNAEGTEGTGFLRRETVPEKDSVPASKSIFNGRKFTFLLMRAPYLTLWKEAMS